MKKFDLRTPIIYVLTFIILILLIVMKKMDDEKKEKMLEEKMVMVEKKRKEKVVLPSYFIYERTSQPDCLASLISCSRRQMFTDKI